MLVDLNYEYVPEALLQQTIGGGSVQAINVHVLVQTVLSSMGLQGWYGCQTLFILPAGTLDEILPSMPMKLEQKEQRLLFPSPQITHPTDIDKNNQ